MTYRERREARAERLREWADKREAKAAELHARNAPYRGDHAFNTQPGHIPERARVIARAERAHEHADKARSMNARADSIDRQAAAAIYSDDVDAVERLREKLARLEAERDRWKAYNAACRKAKGATAEALELLDARQRADLAQTARTCPSFFGKFGQAPAYHVSNLTGNITRLRARLAGLERAAAREDVTP